MKKLKKLKLAFTFKHSSIILKEMAKKLSAPIVQGGASRNGTGINLGILVTAQNSVNSRFCVKRVCQECVAIGLVKSLEDRDCMKYKIFHVSDGIIFH